MMPMNQSMMPYLLQMMQGGGGSNGMPQMQNMAPQLSLSQGGMRAGGTSPQQMPMQQQQQRPQGGAIGQAVQTGNNLGTLGKWGQTGYNAAFGSTAPDTPTPGTSFTGASPQSGMMNQQNFMGAQTPPMDMQYSPSGYGQAGPISGVSPDASSWAGGQNPFATAGQTTPGQYGMYGGSSTMGGMDAAQMGADGSTAAGTDAASADTSGGIMSYLQSLWEL